MKKLGKGLLSLLIPVSLGVLYFFFGTGRLATPKIYDCFLFYNEFDLLEIRLNELSSVVDKFVIVEAAETFRGNPKPFIFPQNKERFRDFADKIIYVQVKGHYDTQNPWKRERYQRDQILEGLKGCNNQDIILISDVDEIIPMAKISEIALPIIQKKAELVVCEQSMHYGYLNHLAEGVHWRGPVATTYSRVKQLKPRMLRKLRHLNERKLHSAHITKFQVVANGGWHFTSMGGIQQLITKLESFSHSELDTPENKDPVKIRQSIAAYPRVPIDKTFPKFVQENQEYLMRCGLIEVSDDAVSEN